MIKTELVYTSNVVAGVAYKVTVRAHNAHGWGPESDFLLIVAAKGPDTPDPPQTAIFNYYVRISWTAPYANSAPINAYTVYIAEKTGI